MREEEKPLPPVPEHTPPLKEDEVSPSQGKHFNQVWHRWFTAIRSKVNVINDTVTALSRLVGNGIVLVDAGVATTVSRTDLIAGPNIRFNTRGDNRILDNGDGPITISASGGTSWELLAFADPITTPIPHLEVDVADWSNVLVYILGVTSDAPSFRGVVVSTDGGETFLSSMGDYTLVSADGTSTDTYICLTHQIDTTEARSSGGAIYGTNLNGPKWFNALNLDTSRLLSFDAGPITHIRVVAMPSAGNFSNLTGGAVYVYGQ